MDTSEAQLCFITAILPGCWKAEKTWISWLLWHFLVEVNAQAILETVLHRRKMPAQFALKHFSRIVSSIGHIPAVTSGVLRPEVFADAFGMQQGCKGGWVHYGTLKLDCMIILPSQTQGDKENCFPSEETRCGLSWAAGKSLSWRGSHCSWPCGLFEGNTQSTRLANELCGEIIEERMWKET